MSGSKAFDELSVPEGWKLDHESDVQSIVSTPSPEVYYASIDWGERCFRSGMTTFGSRINHQEYAGPGWRQRLVNDAVAWLRKLYQVKQ